MEMEIVQTKSYDMFKKIKGNRGVSESAVNRLMQKISNQNLLAHFPILVNDNFEVIDGQHRLEVAKRLNLPIYFTVSHQANIKSTIQLNSLANIWKYNDFLELYCSKGNKNYLFMKNIMNKYGVSYSVFHNANSLTGNDTKKFQNGELEVDFINTEIVIQKIKEIENIDKKIAGYKSVASIIKDIVISKVDFEWSKFLNDFPLFANEVKATLTMTKKDTFHTFEKIYNHRRRKIVNLQKLIYGE